MKVQRAVKVILASPEGDAIFRFRVPGFNEVQRESEETKKLENPIDRTKKELEFTFSRLISIEGLVDDEGNSISIAEVQKLDLPVNTLIAIQQAYIEAYLGSVRPKEPSPEKKDDSKE